MAKKINPIFEGLPEDKTATAIKKEVTVKTPKRKSSIKKVAVKQDIKPEQIKQTVIEFEEITFVSNTTYKLNYIGIRRILMKVGKYIPRLKLEPQTQKETIWVQFCSWWNNRFNKPESYILAHNELDVNTKIEIFESDK